jgi:hypothetical protein
MSDLASPFIPSGPAYLEITFGRIVSIWWAYCWRHMLYGGGAVLVIQAAERLIGLGERHLLLSLGSVLVLMPVQVVVLGIVLHKQFRHFSIRLVASPR